MAQRQVPCPFCTGEILTKKAGKILSHIAGFLQKSFSIKIPTGLLKLISDHTPVAKTAALKGPCKACNGKGTIPDPSDQTSVNQQIQQNFKNNAKEITKLESYLGGTTGCGNRYTIVQGSDLLEVGLGMNDAPSYNVVQGGTVRNKGLIDHPSLSQKGAPMFPVGAPANYVQGINSVASPGGHYFIKCANKLSILTGAQGVDITTGGPITISGGITRITGPEITVGTQTGPLTLEGEVVYLNGKSIEVAPSDGDLFVKGTISNTGNLRVGGHLHAESISFIHAECVGTKGYTDEASPSDFHTREAYYGSEGIEGIEQATFELQAFVLSNITDPEKVKNLIGPAHLQSFTDKIKNMAYQMQPYEILPTGWILPGTTMAIEMNLEAVCPCNFGGATPPGPVVGVGTATVISPIDIHNFPHTHALPDLKHNHSIMLPDLDYTAQTDAAVRSKTAAHAHLAAPAHKATDALKTIEATFQSLASDVFAPTWTTLCQLVKKIGL
jgi:hypothetical protein